jgi:hypothetical protein
VGISTPLGVAAAGLPNKGDKANAVLSGVFTAVGPSQPFAFRGPMDLAIWASINTALTTTAGSLAATVASAAGVAAGDAINSVNVPPGTTIGALAEDAVTLAVPAVTLTGTINTVLPQISGLASTAGLLGATVTLPSNNENAVLPANTTVTAILQAAVPATNQSPGVPGIVQISNVPTAAPPNVGAIPFSFALTGNAIVTSGTDDAALFTGAAIEYVGTVQTEVSFDGGSTWIVDSIALSGTLAQFTAGTPVNIRFGEPEREVYRRLNCTAFTAGPINFRISQTGGAAESLAIGPLT